MNDSQTRRPNAPEPCPFRLTWTKTVTPLTCYVLMVQLTEAVQSRDRIGQAKGILMARNHCNAEVAWTMLRNQSQHTNTRLPLVVDAIIESALR